MKERESEFIEELRRLCEDYNIAGFLVEANELAQKYEATFDPSEKGSLLTVAGHLSFYSNKELLEVAGVDIDFEKTLTEDDLIERIEKIAPS